MTFARQHERHLIRSPLRYPGSKAFLVDTVKHIIKNSVFIEAYAGSAILSLNLARSVKCIVINDIDPSIYSFWLAVRDNSKQLSGMVLSCEISINEWIRQREIYNSKEISLESGFAFLYLNRTNFSGMAIASPIGGMEQDGKYKINARFHRSSISKWILKANGLLAKADILNQDALSLCHEDGFLYLDPPYLGIDGRIYRYNYTITDMQKILDELKKRRQPWLLSHNPNNWMESALTEFYRMDIDHRYGIKTPYEKGTVENIWSNVPIARQTKLMEIEKVMT